MNAKIIMALLCVLILTGISNAAFSPNDDIVMRERWGIYNLSNLTLRNGTANITTTLWLAGINVSQRLNSDNTTLLALIGTKSNLTDITSMNNTLTAWLGTKVNQTEFFNTNATTYVRIDADNTTQNNWINGVDTRQSADNTTALDLFNLKANRTEMLSMNITLTGWLGTKVNLTQLADYLTMVLWQSNNETIRADIGKKSNLTDLISANNTIYGSLGEKVNLTQLSGYETTTAHASDNATLAGLLTTTFFNASIVDTVIGTPQGTLPLIQVYDDIPYNVSEANSDIDFRVNFTGITDFNQIIVRYSTIVGENHVVDLSIWDTSSNSWEYYRSLAGTNGNYDIITMTVFDPSTHITGGIVQLRFATTNIGITTDKWNFDWVELSKGAGTPSSTETDPVFVANRTSIWDNIVALNANNDTLSAMIGLRANNTNLVSQNNTLTAWIGTKANLTDVLNSLNLKANQTDLFSNATRIENLYARQSSDNATLTNAMVSTASLTSANNTIYADLGKKANQSDLFNNATSLTSLLTRQSSDNSTVANLYFLISGSTSMNNTLTAWLGTKANLTDVLNSLNLKANQTDLFNNATSLTGEITKQAANNNTGFNLANTKSNQTDLFNNASSLTGLLTKQTADNNTGAAIAGQKLNLTGGTLSGYLNTTANMTFKQPSNAANMTASFLYDSAGVCVAKFNYWNGTHHLLNGPC